jgi:hypothetical protein
MFLTTIGAGIPLLGDAPEQDASTSHEKAFRDGNFQLAVSLADAVLAKDPENVPAELTKLRVYDAHFRTDTAQAAFRELVSKGSDRSLALAALPKLSFAETMPGLMDEYMRYSPAASLGAERIRALRLWTKRAGDDGLCRLASLQAASANDVLHLRYSPHNPGLIGLRTSINGGPPLRLVLNTSAFGLWLPPVKARAAGIDTLGEGWISEPGMYSVANGAYGFAGQLQTHGALIRNVPVFVAPGTPFNLFDGIVGTSTFRDLNIEVHPSELNIVFTKPTPDSQRSVPSPPARQRVVQCVRNRHVPLLHGRFERRPTLILIQFQAEISTAHQTPPLRVYPNETDAEQALWLTGFTCQIGSDSFASSAEFDIAGDSRSIVARRCDLSEISRKLSLNVGAVAGLNAFQKDRITLDQIRGLVAFD